MNEPVNTQRDWPGMGFALGFFILGSLAWWQTQEMSAMGAVFPRTVSLAMIVCAAAYIVQALWRHTPPVPRNAGSWPRRIALIVVMAIWIGIMPHLGFLSSGLLAFLVLSVVANYDGWTPWRWGVYTVTAVAVVAGFYGLFAEGLNVPLPRGWLR